MIPEPILETRVFAPATVANVACGYDVLGFAIDSPGDEVVVRHSNKPGLRITTITGDHGKLPKDPEKIPRAWRHSISSVTWACSIVALRWKFTKKCPSVRASARPRPPP